VSALSSNSKTIKVHQKFHLTIIALFMLIELSSCCQTIKSNKKEFSIDKTIHSEVDKRIKQFNKQANSNISYKIYDGDKIIKTSNSFGEPSLSFTTFVENSILINCLNGVEEGLGFDLILSDDTILLNFKLLSKFDENSLEQDIPPEILVECLSYKIALADKPNFTKGELVEGKIELESEYYTAVTGKEKRKLKCTIEAYFRSEPLPIIDGKYLTLETKEK
jgi:hypothetical protein